MSCFQRFTQYLASSNSNFQLANFLDKTGVQGKDGRGGHQREGKVFIEQFRKDPRSSSSSGLHGPRG